MAKTTDILLDDNGRLRVENGDFVIGDASVQNEKLIIALAKGELKQFPLSTVGAITYKDDEGQGELMREIQLRLTDDGMQVNKVKVVNGNIQTDAYYK